MAKVDPALASMTAALAGVYGLLMTPKDVQGLLKCGRSMAYEWCGPLPAICVGKRRLYRVEDVAGKVMASQEKKGVYI